KDGVRSFSLLLTGGAGAAAPAQGSVKPKEGFTFNQMISPSRCSAAGTPCGAGVVTNAIAPVIPPTIVAANHNSPSAIASSFRIPAIPNSTRQGDSRISQPLN